MCTLDFVLIRSGKVTDMETTAFERRIYCLHFLRERNLTCHVGSHGEAPGFVKRQKPREEESMDHSLLFSMEKAKLGKGNDVGLDNLNNVMLLGNRSIL